MNGEHLHAIIRKKSKSKISNFLQIHSISSHKILKINILPAMSPLSRDFLHLTWILIRFVNIFIKTSPDRIIWTISSLRIILLCLNHEGEWGKDFILNISTKWVWNMIILLMSRWTMIMKTMITIRHIEISNLVKGHFLHLWENHSLSLEQMNKSYNAID